MESQGDWMPTCKLLVPRKGQWYGFGGQIHANCQGREETGPAIWITRDIGWSTNQPLYLPKGRYKGQIISGDNRIGHNVRCFVEKVDGRWQGAVFYFSGGFDSGIERMVLGPDSLSIFMVGLGDGGNSNWRWRQNWLSAVHRLEENGNKVFDILHIRNMGETLFEISFTEPAGEAAGNANNYTVQSWENNPSKEYGAGHQQNKQVLSVTDAQLSEDGRKVLLTVKGVQKHRLGRQVRFILGNSIRSREDDELWTKIGDYTLHNFGPAQWPLEGCTDPLYEEYSSDALFDDGSCATLSLRRVPETGDGASVRLQKQSNGVSIHIPFNRAWRVTVNDLQGKTVHSFEGEGPASNFIKGTKMDKGAYVLQVSSGSQVDKKILPIF
jgi:hypothetical protein